MQSDSGTTDMKFILRRAHVYKEVGAHGYWWTFDVYETEGPLKARWLMTGTRRTWAQAYEAAWAWVSKDLRPTA